MSAMPSTVSPLIAAGSQFPVGTLEPTPESGDGLSPVELRSFCCGLPNPWECVLIRRLVQRRRPRRAMTESRRRSLRTSTCRTSNRDRSGRWEP